MAKRGYKRSSRQDSVNAGCKWALISMFNFRQSHFVWKLLSNRIHVNERIAGDNDSQFKYKFLANTEENSEDFIDNERNKGTVLAPRKTLSVRDLIKEEMSVAHVVKKDPKYEPELLQSDLEIQTSAEKIKKANRHRRVVSDIVAGEVKDASNVGSHSEHFPNLVPQRNPFTYDLSSFMLDFYYSNNQCRERHANRSVEYCRSQESDAHCNEISFELTRTHTIIQKALSDVANLLLEQKSIAPKSFISCREIIQSKEFMDALEVQDSVKGLFHKLLQSPDSFLSKHIENLQNALTENPSEILSCKINANSEKNDDVPSRRSVYRFFRKKEKQQEPKAAIDTDNSCALNRIVILKPCPMGLQNLPIERSQGCSSSQLRSALNHHARPSRPASPFSFSGMKKRLKYVFGSNWKERHLIMMDAVLHKIPYGSNDLRNEKSVANLGDTSRTSTFFGRGNKKAKAKDVQSIMIGGDISSEDKYKGLHLNKFVHPPIHRRQFTYEEARKHLSEMIDSTNKKEKKSSRSLASLLQLRNYGSISPIFSNVEDSLSTGMILPSQKQHCMGEAINNTSLHNVVDLPCHDSNPEALANKIMETNYEEGANIKGFYEEESLSEYIVTVNEPLESVDKEANLTSECNVKEDESLAVLLDAGSFKEGSQQIVPSICTPPRALFIDKGDGQEIITETSDRSSPVSVLEQFFTDDTASPDHATTESEGNITQPQHLPFEDEPCIITKVGEKAARFNYVRTVLELSGLCCDEMSEGWNSSDQLLDLSLFDEMRVSNIQQPEDVELLFDTVNEVLEEIQERFFSSDPWVSRIKKEFRAVPKGEDVIEKVWKRIEWHLQTHFPSTLDQIVGKDLDGVTWMVLGLDIEYLVSEMGDAVLDDLVEEAMLELWE